MDESTLYGNRFHLPFTRDEVLRAESLTGRREHAELVVRMIYDEPDEETTGVTIMDGSLLYLAYLSEDVARRVIEYRPSLRPEVVAGARRPRGMAGDHPASEP